jgi:hypothetical protein
LWNPRITVIAADSPSIVVASATAPCALSSAPGRAAESRSSSLGVVPRNQSDNLLATS